MAKIKTTTLPLLTASQTAALRDIIETLRGDLEAGPEDRFGLTGLEETSLAGLENIAAGVGGAEGDVLPAARQGLTDLLGTAGERFDQFFTTNIEAPLLETFGQDILPEIERRFAGSGFFGSARERAVEGATEELLDVLGRERSRSALGAEQLRLGALSLAPGLAEGAVETDILTQILPFASLERDVARLNDTLRLETIASLLAAISVPQFENIAAFGQKKGGSSLVASSLIAGGADIITALINARSSGQTSTGGQPTGTTFAGGGGGGGGFDLNFDIFGGLFD